MKKRLLAVTLSTVMAIMTIAPVGAAETAEDISDNNELQEATEEIEQVAEEEILGASSGTFKDGGSYSLDDSGVLTISGSGAVGDYRNWKEDKLKIKTIVFSEGITSYNGDFRNFAQLEAVQFPSTMKEISDDMFYGCNKLKSVNIPDSASVDAIGFAAFYNCISLESFDFPSSLKTIDDFAFWNCHSLKTLEFNEGLSNIGDAAFYGCYSVETINIPSTLTSQGKTNPFVYTSRLGFDMESGIGIIDEELRRGFPELKSINVAEGNLEYTDADSNVLLRTSDGCLMLGCKNTEFKEGAGVVCIGERAFWGCKGLKSAILPDGIKEIETDAFYGSGIEQLYIPASVESIDGYNEGFENPFSYCESLTSIVVSTDNEYYTDLGSNALFSAVDNKYYFISGCNGTILPDLDADTYKIIFFGPAFAGSRIEKLYIPACASFDNDVEDDSEGYRLCKDCKKLKNITVSEYNTSLDSRENCNAVIQKSNDQLIIGCKGTVIPDGVKSVCRLAFSGSGIEELNIPGSVTDIGTAITSGCDDLSSIKVNAENTVYRAENNCLIKKDGSKIIAGCKSSVIPESVKEIGPYAFDRISSLKEIEVPSGVETIQGGAFRLCTGLKTVNLPAGLKNLGTEEDTESEYNTFDDVFYGCSSLEKITFPEGMKTIGYGSLYYCDSLESIAIPADFPGDVISDDGLYDYFTKCSLKDIYFGGTKEQWLALTRQDEFGTNMFDAYNIQFNAEISGDTDPENPDVDADGVLKAAIAANKGAVTDTIGFTVDNSKKKPVYTVSPSQNGLAITVVKGSKFTIVGGEKKSFTSNSGNVKVSSKGVVSAKKAESKAEIKYKLQGETEPKTLYVTVIEPGLAKAENTNGEIKKLSLSAVTGNVIDATLAFPINATIGSVKGKTACVKDLKTEVSANGIHITGTADQKGNLTIPITATGKKYNVKIKVKASK